MKYISFLLMLIFMRTGTIAFASDVRNILSVENIKNEIKLTNIVEYFADSSGKRTLEDIQHDNTISWTPSSTPTNNFGLSKNKYWFRYKVKTAVHNPVKDYVFKIPFSRLEHVEYYAPDRNTYKKISLGFLDKIPDRPLRTHEFAVPIEIEPEPRMHFFSVQSHSYIQVPAMIQEAEAFGDAKNQTNVVFAMYAAIVVIMSLYNLFLYFSLRDISYLLYAGFTISFAGLLLTIEGFDCYFDFVQNNIWLKYNIIHIVGPLSHLFLVAFVRQYLKTKTNSVVSEKLMRFSTYFCVTLLFLGVTFQKWSDLLAPLLTSLCFISVVVSSILCFNKVRAARFLLGASIILVTSTVVFTLQLADVIPSTIASQHSMTFGSIAEITLLSLGLADKINALNNGLQNSKILLEKTNVQLRTEIIEKNKAQDMVNRQHNVLLDGERFRIMGEMSASIIHEIKNPLMVITMRAQQLAQSSAMKSIQPDEVEVSSLKIVSMGKRISKIIDSITSLARKSSTQVFENCKLETIIEDSKELCLEKFRRSNIQLKISGIDPEFNFQGNYTQISQVLINLLNNAADAVANNENKWVEVGFADHGEFFDLTVTDCGSGIPIESQKKIFAGFYTTKEKGKGTGIGLHLSQSIVMNHNGQIFIDNECKNTRFVVRLPKNQMPQLIEKNQLA